MKDVSVIITSFQRAWALKYSLRSLLDQTVPADEIIIVLKPSGDGSEKVIEKFRKMLPIKLLLQKRGNVAEAEEIGIKSSNGHLTIFLDDDAVAEKDFVKKWVEFFKVHSDAGGASGSVLKAYLRHDLLIRTQENYFPRKSSNLVYLPKYCKPLKIFRGYSGWISKSGLLFSLNDYIRTNIAYNGVLYEANMAFLSKLIKDCPVGKIFKNSRKCYSWGSLLAYWVRHKGFHTYAIRYRGVAPTIWHIVHSNKLTTCDRLWDRLWFSFDVFKNYWRYKNLRADVSFKDYLVATAALVKKDVCARLLAFLFALIR